MTIKDARKAARVTCDTFDAELELLMDAAQADLETAGVYEPEDDDPMYELAKYCYIRAYFLPDKEDAERSRASYEDIKSSLKLSGRCRRHEQV